MKELASILLALILATAATLWMGYGKQIFYPASEPLETIPPQPTIQSDTVRLVFGGDLMQHLPQVEAAQCADGSFDYSRSFEYITPLFRSADAAILNLETTLTTSKRYSGYPSFASPTDLADAMVDMGVDIALLANNHCCDRGSQGIETTIEQLKRRGIAHTGAFADSEERASHSPLYFERRGIRFALINYTYSTNGIPTPKGRHVNRIDTTAIKHELRTIDKDSVDCIIACMHWGIEYERRPNRTQLQLENLLKREGVDIIIGSHPHVIQPFMADSVTTTFYSLGNLVSNQRKRYTDGGLIAEIEVVRCDTIEGIRLKATPHPVWVLCPDYRILSREVADTMAMTAQARQACNTFFSDSDKLLGIKQIVAD